MQRERLRIGLFGYGCVGQGLHDIINSSGFDAEIVKICVKHGDKPRRLPARAFTLNRYDILDDSEINLVVELTNDAREAFNIVSGAMERGKMVVTAGKAMVANNLAALTDMQSRYGVPLLYEASACASIPVIRNLEEYYDNELLNSVEGIFNGSTNYILSKMESSGAGYHDVLREAMDNGFAESDPTLDVTGLDSKQKLCIITAHAYGLFPRPDDIFHTGIENITEHDIRYAREKGLRIRLVAHVSKCAADTITAFVMPRFVQSSDKLYHVKDEYNGVIAEGAFADRQFFYGKGAGGHATGCAVLSDISACSYGYRYEYKKRARGRVKKITNDHLTEIYLRYNLEEERRLFGFKEITEYFCGTGFRYVKGVVNLQTLYQNREAIRESGVFMVKI